MKAPSEHSEQSALMRWAGLLCRRYPELELLHHIPNGGSRDRREAANLKRAGVKPGVPDLCLPVARRGYHGLYIELKSLNGRLTEKQKAWGEALKENGYFWRVCRGAREAARTLEWYMGGEDNEPS